MRAAVYRGVDDVRVEDLPRPEAGAGELLVRVACCGVCWTDLKKVDHGTVPPPRVFGHEMAGVVAHAGEGVARFREGDRVQVYHHIPCRSCPTCERRLYAQCPVYKRTGTTAGFEPAGGGFAEYVKALDWIVARGAIPVPDGVLPEEAAFVEPVNTCLKAVRRAGVERGQAVLVVGQGPIGLLLTQLCRWSGADVLASDTLADRREVAGRLGASAVLDAAGDVAREVRALTGGRGADCVFLAALGQAALDQAVDSARPGGRIIVFAATSPGETARLDLGALCAAEKEILTSYSASVDVQDLAARLVFGREVRVRELVSHRFPLAQAARALEVASHPAPGVLKVVLQVPPEETAR